MSAITSFYEPGNCLRTADLQNRIMSIACRESVRETVPKRNPWLCLVLLLLTGFLIFAHGCHGDEDNELFTGRRFSLAAGGAVNKTVSTLAPEEDIFF
jgi:hypothetical protein